METIISACISAAVTLLVCMMNNQSQQKKAEAQQQETRALVAYRLEHLENKVQAHNNLVERMYRVEEKTDLHEEKLKVANHRIGDLEKKGGQA